MFCSADLDSELKAIYMTGSKGSEILLFRRNVGLVGRFNVPQTGAQLDTLILTMKQACAGGDLKVNSWSLVERVLQKYFDVLASPVKWSARGNRSCPTASGTGSGGFEG